MKNKVIMKKFTKKLFEIITNSDIYIVLIPLIFYSVLLVNALRSGLSKRPSNFNKLYDNSKKINFTKKDSGFSNKINKIQALNKEDSKKEKIIKKQKIKKTTFRGRKNTKVVKYKDINFESLSSYYNLDESNQALCFKKLNLKIFDKLNTYIYFNLNNKLELNKIFIEFQDFSKPFKKQIRDYNYNYLINKDDLKDFKLIQNSNLKKQNYINNIRNYNVKLNGKTILLIDKDFSFIKNINYKKILFEKRETIFEEKREDIKTIVIKRKDIQINLDKFKIENFSYYSYLTLSF